MSKCLHPDEWLAEAKRLHVGESKRVYHGAERRPNLLVSNKQDKYTAWCFSCNKGGVHRKGLVRMVQPQQQKERPALSADPGICWNVELLTHSDYVLVLAHLQEKGMSLEYLLPLRPTFSFKDRRLVLQTPECCIGRDITGMHKAKWHTYTENVQYARARFKDFKDSTVVLTEDLYSAAKIGYWVPDVLPVACLGTRISAALMERLLTAKEVITWFDGDSAGDKARVEAARVLGLMEVPFRHISTTQDPKALSDKTIKELLNEHQTDC